VIIAVSNPAIQAAKDASPTVPIIMAFAGEDPVAAGFIGSLSRPGGSITGLAMLATETEAKRVELAAQAMPGAKRIAFLINPHATAERVALVQQSAAAMGIELTLVRAQDGSDYDDAFKALAKADVAMLVIGSSPVFLRDVTELSTRASALRLPLTCEWREMAQQGCLIAYGPNARKLNERIGDYTGRVLQGSKPQDLPVEQPTAFELVLNLKTAKALGLEIPPSLLARADEVIE
jgi:putative ABC transport system substrate-binding protein